MEEEEHEVYGGDIPVEDGDVDMSAADDDAIKVSPASFLTTTQIDDQYGCACVVNMLISVVFEFTVVFGYCRNWMR